MAAHPTRMAAALWRRHTLALAALAWLALTPADAAEAPGHAAVGSAIAAYVKAWNSHSLPAWSAFLTEDVQYTEATDFYERFKGRDKVIGWFEYNVKNSDLAWEPLRMKTQADGSVSVLLRQRMSMLPVKDGKYASVFDSDPSLARWRQEGGQWKLFFFTSHKGWALDLAGKQGLQ